MSLRFTTFLSAAQRRGLLVAVVVAIATPACSMELGSSTEGEKGRARFAYVGSCFFGCAVDHPVLEGGAARISVQGELPELVAVSADASVLSVELERSYACCRSTASSSECASSTRDAVCADGFDKTIGHTLNVRGLKSGSSRVALHDLAGHEVDAIQLEVSSPAAATLTTADAERRALTTITLAEGADLPIRAELHDVHGRPLETDSGVVLSVDDADIATFDDPAWFGPEAGVSSIEQRTFQLPRLRARTTGLTAVRVHAGAFERAFAVEVK